VLRRALIAASHSERLRELAMTAPPARHVAHRFVAGETLDEALAVTTRLNRDGMSVTLDHLGESVQHEAYARQAADVYLETLDRVGALGLDCSVSVKPTQMGLHLSVDICEKLISAVCERAATVGTHVTIDMEGSDTTQATVGLVRRLRAAGHDNVGCAVQSYLHRTVDDVRSLTTDGASLRLCKGAYAEPEDIAYHDRAEISRSYLRAAEVVLRAGVFGRFATHDHRLILGLRNLARRLQIGSDAYEFQMLYGIREPLQEQVVAAGHRLRIYVPFGDQWYPYFVRRLAERPANMVFFLRALAG
jgi:proline dehydrogenase